MMKKIIGFLLLSIGLLVIFWSVYSSYEIFTVKREIPQMFRIVKQTQESTTKKSSDAQEQLEGIMEGVLGEKINEVLPPEFLPKILNLVSWSMLAGLLIFSGNQIASLGIKLIKIND